MITLVVGAAVYAFGILVVAVMVRQLRKPVRRPDECAGGPDCPTCALAAERDHD